MALPSFLKRKTAAPTAPDDAGIVQRARTSARRRLIGAAVLLAIGVIAFPLLFETQPRPIPVDIPIEIPRKEGQPPLTAPAKPARVATGTVPDPVPRAAAEPSTAASVAAAASATRPAVAPATPPARAATPADGGTTVSTMAPAAPAAPVPASTVKSAPAPASSALATAPKDARSAEATSKPASAPVAADLAAAGRYVVQVGAFAEATSAREVRLKVEKLGLKTYTQVVETAQGRRIRVRVGPFASQAEADKTLARLKAAKLPGAVLTL